MMDDALKSWLFNDIVFWGFEEETQPKLSLGIKSKEWFLGAILL